VVGKGGENRSKGNALRSPSESWIQQAVLRLVFPLLAILPVLYNSSARHIPVFFVDEIYWIGSTYYYELAFVQRDWSHPDWQLLPARENPPLGKYVMGAFLSANGRSIKNPNLLGSFYLMFASTPGAWGSDKLAFEKRLAIAERVESDVAEPILKGAPVSIDFRDVACARLLMVILGCLTSVGIYLIAYRLGTPGGGVVAAILFGCHPVVIPAYTTAMIDVVALCFAIWSLFLFLPLLRFSTFSKRSKVPTIIGASTMLALACGSKMNSVIAAVMIVICTIYSLVCWMAKRNLQEDQQLQIERKHYKDVADSGVLICLFAFLIFVLMNPTIHLGGLDALDALFSEHRLTAVVQAEFLGGGLTSLKERAWALSELVGRSPPITAILLVMVAYQIRRSFLRKEMFMFVLVWWVTATCLLLAWLPFSWPRYVLPLIPPTALVVGKVSVDTALGLKDLIVFLKNTKEAPRG
jgi:hypothetical protein